MTEITVQENVVVADLDGRKLTVDVFRPSDVTGPVSGLLFLPGGGWQTADRAPLRERYGVRIAQQGYVCVTGEYRVMEEAPWPAQIQDVKAIIRWMRANHDSLGIEPSRIVVGGKSAGGHLALLAAGARGIEEFEGDGGNASFSSDVAAVIGVAPVSDIAEWARRPALEPLFGKNPPVQVINAANPISYISGDYPPTLLIHGTSDQRVPHALTLQYYRALEEAGVPVDLHLFAGEDHFFDREPEFNAAVADSIAFFMSRLVPARAAVATP